MVKGLVNTDVNLEILPKGSGKSKFLTLTRSKIEIKTVAYTIYGDAAYIRITGFTNKTGEEFSEALDKINRAGTNKLLLDLRDNGGGTIRGCIDTARKILSNETIVKLEFGYNGYLDIRYTASQNPREYEIAVLVNEGTASAAEILSAAIQDNGKGMLVGENTFGKSLVQSSYLILTDEAYDKYSRITGETNMYVITKTLTRMNIKPDDDEWLGALKLTIGEYMTPNGESINNTGINPDVFVEYDGPIAFDEIQEGEIFVYDKYNIGMASEQIINAKVILGELGFFFGEMTGYYDEEVFDSVMKFQKEEGLYPYGVLDFTTQNALNNRLRLIRADSDLQFFLAYRELTKEEQ